MCGVEAESVSPLESQDAETGDRICSLCSSFDLQIGRELPDARFAVLGMGEPADRPTGTALDVLAAFGVSVDFAKDAKQVSTDSSRIKPDRAVVWLLDDADKIPQVKDLPSAPLLRYTVNQVPRKTFDEMQAAIKQGIQRLGVLRMDVDNLGEAFKYGFECPGEESIATLARLSTLSFQLSLYFEGWIKRLCDQSSEDVYTVYAGGDDVFLIGPWVTMIDLAKTINDEFQRYTRNSGLTLSGGMTFIHGKYPVYQAAEDARKALEKAKEIDAGKNAFTFLDRPWKWAEFSELGANFSKLEYIISNLNGPHSLLQVLQQLAIMEEEKASQRIGRPLWGRWMWMGDYRLTRLARLQKNKKLAGEIEQVLEELKKEFYSNIIHWGTAARWAQLYTRKTGSNK